MRAALPTLFALASASKFTGPNMNGEYKLAATPNQTGWPSWLTNTSFRDYPGGVEMFEVHLGPVTSTYGEVFWTHLPSVGLPDELKQRFKGKGMAVVGFEADQVRKGAGPNGEDVSVPINVAYNHHCAPPADQTPHVRLTERSTGSRESCSSWYVCKSFFYFRSFYLESSASSV